MVRVYVCVCVFLPVLLPLSLPILANSRIPQGASALCFRQRTQFPVHSHFPFPVRTVPATVPALPSCLTLSRARHSHSLALRQLNSCSVSASASLVVVAVGLFWLSCLCVCVCESVFHAGAVCVHRIKAAVGYRCHCLLFSAAAVAASATAAACPLLLLLSFVLVCVRV